MKKMTLLALVLITTSAAFAQQVTGKVVKVIPEEEGVKVILESSKGYSSLFSTRTSGNHLEIKQAAENALTTGKTINIQVKNKKNDLTEIVSVKGQ